MGTQTLRVGYRPTPGLIWPTLENTHKLEGFEYDLLLEMAHQLGLPVEFICLESEVALIQNLCQETDHQTLSQTSGLKKDSGRVQKSINVAVGALHGSARLEEKLDILFPHLRSSTLVLVKKSMGHWVKAALRDLTTAWISRALLVGGLLFCYFPAFLTTLVEMEIPGSSFESATANPFLTAAWYAVVTISTVGYGDLSPVTATGRLLAAPMIAFAPLLYVGLVQQLWLTFKNAFFRAQYLDGDTLKTGGSFQVAAVTGTAAHQAVSCQIGCCQVHGFADYTALLEAARTADQYDVLIVDAPVAAYILDTFPMKWSLGQEIAEGLGYSCLVPEGFSVEEEMRRLVFAFHENGTLKMLRDRYFNALNE